MILQESGAQTVINVSRDDVLQVHALLGVCVGILNHRPRPQA